MLYATIRVVVVVDHKEANMEIATQKRTAEDLLRSFYESGG